jgi:nicotinamide riboside kinase
MRFSSEHPLIICVTGAECTGKTTLAETLAATLQVPLVPEIARAYLAGTTGYTADDVLAIAREQQAAEQAALAERPLVVADTDLTVIQVWWEEKYGELNSWLAAALAERSERRYLLPRPDLPWEFDPLRESPRDRPRLHRRYQQLLECGPFPYAQVEGVGEARFLRAIAQVEDWLA